MLGLAALRYLNCVQQWMGLNIVVVATGRLSKEGGSNDRGKLACWPLDCRPEACRVGSIYGGLGL